MEYNEALRFIANECSKGSVYDLFRIKELSRRLSFPGKSMRVIHVAGTNGKGSVSRMLMNILKCAGYRTGIFNSPFIEKRNEYLCVNGRDASDSEFGLIAGVVKNACLGRGNGCSPMQAMPTEFEFCFAMALEYFARSGCRFAIIECGLGGLNDATNIFDKKELNVIMSIGLDHVNILGNSLKKIAFEKCGIIEPGGTVVAYPSDPEAMEIIKRECGKKKADLTVARFPYDLCEKDSFGKTFTGVFKLLGSLSLRGEFQKKNAAVALCCIKKLKESGYRIPEKAVKEGLGSVTWHFRFETLLKEPRVIADGGHNAQCAQALALSLDKEGIKKAVFVIGIMADKDYKSVFSILSPYAEAVIVTEPDNPRRLPAEDALKAFMEASEVAGDEEVCTGSEVTGDEPICTGSGVTGKKQVCFGAEAKGNDWGSFLPDRFVIEKEPDLAIKKALKLDLERYGNKLPIVVTGSFYMMGAIDRALKDKITLDGIHDRAKNKEHRI